MWRPAVERIGQARVLRSKNVFKGGDDAMDVTINIPLPKPGAEFGEAASLI